MGVWVLKYMCAMLHQGGSALNLRTDLPASSRTPYTYRIITQEQTAQKEEEEEEGAGRPYDII